MNGLFSFLVSKPEVANAIATIAAVFISALSTILALWALALQRRHSYLSVRPLAFIANADFENWLSVKIDNNGIGPLIIKKLCVSDGETVKDSLIDWLPKLPEGILWDTFVKSVEDRSVPPGGEVVLFRLSDHGNAQFSQMRELCRAQLKKLTIEVHYVDIYDRQMPVSRRSLAWFGRTREVADSLLKGTPGASETKP